MREDMVRVSIAVLASFFILTLLLLCGCADKQSGEQISETRLFLDTYCSITIHGSDDAEVLDEAFALIAEMEALFSITVNGSDVWRINHAGGVPVVVDPRTVEVIAAGLEFGELSDGMLDITIGRLSRLWDFGGGTSGGASSGDLNRTDPLLNDAMAGVG